MAKEIRRAIVVGAGAVGAALAGLVSRRDPGAVAVLADPARMARYRAEGFLLNGERVDFPLVGTDEQGEAELLIVAVKNHQLPAAIEAMRNQVGKETLVLSLLNGITSEDDLAAAFGREKVPYAMILGIDATREGNSIAFSKAGRIHFGEAENPPGPRSERVSRIASFFDRTGIDYFVPEDMVRALWYKFMINVGINQASALLRAPYAPFQTRPEAQEAMEAAMFEVVALSKALKTGLEEADLGKWRETLLSLDPASKTSMLQDVEARRKTEVEAFAGTVVRLSAAAGLDAPVNRLLYALIRAIESMY